MLRIKDFRVRSLTIDNNELSWKVEDSYQDALDFTFHVLRSESPEGPFEDLTPNGFKDRYLFIDNSIPTAHRWRQLFYRVRVVQDSTQEFEESGSETREPEPDLIALEIRRHFQLLLREHAGRRAWVLPVRTFGTRCSCFDANQKKKIRSGCRLCWDTTFVRGYLSPIEVFIDVNPSAKAQQDMTVGSTHQSNTTARLGYYPPIKPRDLIIEAENRRWRVGRQTQTEHVRASLQQMFELHEIPPSDVEYGIPLQTDTALRDMFLSPSRNFTNPHNLENFGNEEIPGIFSLYRSSYPGTER